MPLTVLPNFGDEIVNNNLCSIILYREGLGRDRTWSSRSTAAIAATTVATPLASVWTADDFDGEIDAVGAIVGGETDFDLALLSFECGYAKVETLRRKRRE